MLVLEFAFEVEHTTDVTKGLGRLLDLHRSENKILITTLKALHPENSKEGVLSIRTYTQTLMSFRSCMKHEKLLLVLLMLISLIWAVKAVGFLGL